MKKKVSTIIIVILTIILAAIAIFTAIKLYQTGSNPVAPNVPQSEPEAYGGSCNVSFSVKNTPIKAICKNIKVYKAPTSDGTVTSWTLIPEANLPKLKNGDEIYFCISGVTPGTTTEGSFDKGRFKVNGQFLPVTTEKRPGSDEFCSLYKIETITGTSIGSNGDIMIPPTYNIVGQIHHVTEGWK